MKSIAPNQLRTVAQKECMRILNLRPRLVATSGAASVPRVSSVGSVRGDTHASD